MSFYLLEVLIPLQHSLASLTLNYKHTNSTLSHANLEPLLIAVLQPA